MSLAVSWAERMPGHPPERHECLAPVCPDGGSWGSCTEPSHWAEPEEERQHDGGVSSTRQDMTTAHLAGTAEYNLAHAIVHLQAALKPKSPSDRQFNLEHCEHHLDEAQDHLSRLLEHFKQHYPGIKQELDNVEKAEDSHDGVKPV